jgi:hypothetical protein
VNALGKLGEDIRPVADIVCAISPLGSSRAADEWTDEQGQRNLGPETIAHSVSIGQEPVKPIPIDHSRAWLPILS